MIFKHHQNIHSSGPEGITEYDQSLDHPVSRASSRETLSLGSTPSGFPSEGPHNHKWLSPVASTHDSLAFDPWGKLKIADDDTCFGSPAKKNSDCQFEVASPVSTFVACWSPQTPSAPALKTRKSAMEITCG
ncbi:hypothetical protein D1007_11571 [Hordeum vulgare]|nr:hypothetical protein D1007_11571 [Hordeum vulgare]